MLNAHRYRLVVWAAAACLMGWVVPVSADVITTATGTNGADAHVQEGQPTTNFGSNTTVLIKDTGDDTNSVNRKGYFRFDLSSLGAPVTSASLSLQVSVNDGGGTPVNTLPQDFIFHVYGLNDGSTAGNGILGEDWAEGTINWNNAPANIVSGSGARNNVQTGAGTANGGQATFLGSFSLNGPAGTTVQALAGGPNSKLVNFLNADTNHAATLIVTRWAFTSTGGGATAASSNSGFFAKESGSLAAPALLVNQGQSGPHMIGVTSDSTWRVTSTSPPAGWNTSLTFDDSDAAGWQDSYNPGNNNIWLGSTSSSTAPNNTWFRHVFTLDGPVTSATGSFAFDDDGQLYINGHLVINDTGGGATRFNITIDPSFFVQGDNLIAVHGIDTIAPDCSIADEMNIAVAPEPATLPLLALAGSLLLGRRARRACR